MVEIDGSVGGVEDPMISAPNEVTAAV